MMCARALQEFIAAIRTLMRPTSSENEEELLDRIMSGAPTLKNPIETKEVKTALKKLKPKLFGGITHEDRIKLVAERVPIKDFAKLLRSLDKWMSKNENASLYFSEKSNKFYNDKNLEMAIRCSNLALVFAPEESNSIIKLCADRGLILHEMSDWKSAFVDISVSLIHSQSLENEMTTRLEKCRKNCIKNHESEYNGDHEEESKKHQEYCENVLFKIHGELHPKIDSAADYVEICEHSIKERVLVVTKDVKPGTTVIVEYPYVSVMQNGIKWGLKHCAYCYRATNRLIPCPNCVFATYCSEGCRASDFKASHSYECPCMNFLHAVNIPSSFHLAFKTICKAGPKYMYKLYKQSKIESPRTNDKIIGFDPKTGRYRSNSYFQVYHLKGYFEEFVEAHALYSNAMKELLLAKTNFFEKIDPEEVESFAVFVASAILTSALAIPCNVMGVDEQQERGEDDLTSKDSYVVPGISAIYSLSTLMSHSCDPSAVRVNLANGKMAIVTIRALKAGEELTISYGYNFTSLCVCERAEVLESYYYFKCDCTACVRQWPTESILNRKKCHYLCPKCSDNFTYEDQSRNHRSVLKISSLVLMICPNCRHMFDLNYLKKNLGKQNKLLQKARKLLWDDNPIDAIPLLTESIEYFQTHLLAPNIFLIEAQSLLRWAMDDIVTNAMG